MNASLFLPRFTTYIRFIGFQTSELWEGHSWFTAFPINQPSKTTASRCDIHTPPPLGGQSRATDQNLGKDVVLMAVMAGQILSG
jgi:hypothetical protein